MLICRLCIQDNTQQQMGILGRQRSIYAMELNPEKIIQVNISKWDKSYGLENHLLEAYKKSSYWTHGNIRKSISSQESGKDNTFGWGNAG